MSVFRYCREAAVFALCYVALDWASYIDPVGPFNITPWNPQPALAIGWMMVGGPLHAPAVLTTIAGADLLIRHAPGGYLVTLATAALLTAGYGAMAWALKRVLPRVDLRTTAQLASFSLVIIMGSALVGTAFVSLLSAFGVLPAEVWASAAVRFWVGDAVGILVTAPLLLAAANAQRRDELKRLAASPEAWAQAATLAGTIWLIFEGVEGDPARHFYLLFLPLIWIAARSGMAGAIVATAVVQMGVVLGIHGTQDIVFPVLELQALVAALTLTSLFLGVAVDERRRAEAGLRQSLHLAAAGEMAGAIAHEVNQPLTALANYGEAARVLLARGPSDLTEVRGLLDDVLREGARAADVVRRLRDFFRAGTTRLERVPACDLAKSIRRIAQAAIAEQPIELRIDADPDVPALLIDRVQIDLIVRNLVANAVESLSAHTPAAPAIAIKLTRLGEDRACLLVSDNGPGVPPALRDRLFEPFATGKSRGMGLGLVVSRAIADAHGGTLQASRSAPCEFQLVLPCARN